MFKIILKADKMPLTVFLTRLQDSNTKFNVWPHKIMSELFFFPTTLKTNELNTTEHLFDSHQWGRGHGRRSKRSNYADSSRCSSWCWILSFTTMYQKKQKKSRIYSFSVTHTGKHTLDTFDQTRLFREQIGGKNVLLNPLVHLVAEIEFCCAPIGRIGSKTTQQQH